MRPGIVATIVLFIVLSRVPFMSALPHYNDSFNYVWGVQKYEPKIHNPPPPGYPLYTLSGKIVRAFAGDPHRALVIVNILFSVFAALMLYRLGLLLAGPTAAAIATLILVTSPPFWLYGEIVASYSVGLFFALVLVWFNWKALFEDPRYLAHATLLYAVAAGFRPLEATNLVPLWVCVVAVLLARRQVGIGRVLLLLAASLPLALAWFLPTMAYYGGFKAMMEEYGSSAGELAVYANPLSDLVKGYVFNFCAAVVLPPLALAYALYRSRGAADAPVRILFFAAWIIPNLYYLYNVSASQFGYYYSSIGAMLIGSGWLLAELIPRKRLAIAAGVLVFLMNGAVFLFVPYSSDGIERKAEGFMGKLASRARATACLQGIRRREAEIRALTGHIRANAETLKPETTRLIYRRYKNEIRYYLPEWAITNSPFRLDHDHEIPPSPMALTVIVYELPSLRNLGPALRAEAERNKLVLTDGVPLYSFRLPANTALAYVGGKLSVKSQP